MPHGAADAQTQGRDSGSDRRLVGAGRRGRARPAAEAEIEDETEAEEDRTGAADETKREEAGEKGKGGTGLERHVRGGAEDRERKPGGRGGGRSVGLLINVYLLDYAGTGIGRGAREIGQKESRRA
jgi:hypothetical protein